MISIPAKILVVSFFMAPFLFMRTVADSACLACLFICVYNLFVCDLLLSPLYLLLLAVL